jgi:hypothetical protein
MRAKVFSWFGATIFLGSFDGPEQTRGQALDSSLGDHGKSSYFSRELDFLRLILLGRRVRSEFMM